MDQRVAHARAAPRDHVDDPGGKDARDDLRQFQQGQRRLLRWLDHDGIAAGKRGASFQAAIIRVVPRRDGRDDTDRIATDHRRGWRHTRRTQRRASFSRRRRKAEAIGDRRDLVLQHADTRLAAVERLERREVLARVSMASASFNSRRERSAGVVRAQASKAFDAASTAASTCSTEASANSVSSAPVFGFRIFSLASAPATKAEPISSSWSNTRLSCLRN